MSVSKVIPLGDKGQITVSESGGVATVEVAASLEAGGGDIKGFAKATVSAKVDVDGHVLIDAGLAAAKAKFGSNALVAGAIDELKALIDAEVAKV